jgi:hypothetical protein
MPAMVVGFLIIALLVGEIIYELRTGKLLARGWKVYSKREDNPMLFSSRIALHIFVTLFVIGVVALVVAELKK